MKPDSRFTDSTNTLRLWRLKFLGSKVDFSVARFAKKYRYVTNEMSLRFPDERGFFSVSNVWKVFGTPQISSASRLVFPRELPSSLWYMLGFENLSDPWWSNRRFLLYLHALVCLTSVVNQALLKSHSQEWYFRITLLDKRECEKLSCVKTPIQMWSSTETCEIIWNSCYQSESHEDSNVPVQRTSSTEYDGGHVGRQTLRTQKIRWMTCVLCE